MGARKAIDKWLKVVAQAAYHEKYGDYVPNQREFTKSVLSSGAI